MCSDPGWEMPERGEPNDGSQEDRRAVDRARSVRRACRVSRLPRAWRRQAATSPPRRGRVADRVRARLRRAPPSSTSPSPSGSRRTGTRSIGSSPTTTTARASTSPVTWRGSTRSSTQHGPGSTPTRCISSVTRGERSSRHVYLSDPARAAKVAKYVAIDGSPCPAVVPCIAPTQAAAPRSVTRGGGNVEGVLRAAVRVPRRREAGRRRHRPPARAGRALGTSRQLPGQHRPRGCDARHLERSIRTPARRVADGPMRRSLLGDDGAFGPFRASAGAHYEYVLPHRTPRRAPPVPAAVRAQQRPACGCSRRDPNGPTRANTNAGADHAALIAIRMREWYATDDADLPGDQSDVLEVSTDGGARSTCSPTSSATERSGCTSTTTPPRPDSRRWRRSPTSPSNRSRAVSTSSCLPPRRARAPSRSRNIPRGDRARPADVERAELALGPAQRQRRLQRLPRRRECLRSVVSSVALPLNQHRRRSKGSSLTNLLAATL